MLDLATARGDVRGLLKLNLGAVIVDFLAPLIDRFLKAHPSVRVELVVEFGAAVGGLFALVFAYAYGRVGQLGARALSAWLALAAFITLALVPMLKYPANPPSVGMAETIGYRTGLFFLLIAISITTTVFALKMGGTLATRLGSWNASISAAVIYVAIIAVILNVSPPLNEVASNFPAVLLWQFRLAALGMQFLPWTTIGLLFGWLVAQRQPG